MAKKSSKLITLESLKVENTPTHHCRKHKVSGITQTSFLAKFEVSSNKLKKTPTTVFQRPYALCDVLQNTESKLKQLLSKI